MFRTVPQEVLLPLTSECPCKEWPGVIVPRQAHPSAAPGLPIEYGIRGALAALRNPTSAYFGLRMEAGLRVDQADISVVGFAGSSVPEGSLGVTGGLRTGVLAPFHCTERTAQGSFCPGWLVSGEGDVAYDGRGVIDFLAAGATGPAVVFDIAPAERHRVLVGLSAAGGGSFSGNGASFEQTAREATAGFGPAISLRVRADRVRVDVSPWLLLGVVPGSPYDRVGGGTARAYVWMDQAGRVALVGGCDGVFDHPITGNWVGRMNGYLGLAF